MPRLKRLSLKQRKFIKKYVQTGNATESALEAYDVKTKESAQTLGSQTLDLPEVQTEIERVLKKNNITLDNTTLRLQEIAEWAPDKVSSDTVLKANIELLKLMKAYPERVKRAESRSIRINLSSKDYKELIQEHQNTSKEIQDIIDQY